MTGKQLLRTLLVVVFVLAGSAVFSQMGYTEFKSTYKPTYNKIAPDNKAVKIVAEMQPGDLAPVIEVYIDDGNKEMFALLMCSIDRDLAGKTIDAMDLNKAVKGINWLKEEWHTELGYFVSQSTYEKIAPYITGLLNYTGKKVRGTSKEWSPAYLGVGYGLAYSGFRGMNNFVEAYNYEPNKNGGYVLEDEMNKMHVLRGGVFNLGLNMADDVVLDLTWSSRNAYSRGGGTNTSTGETWERSIRYRERALSIGGMYVENHDKLTFMGGLGLHFTSGKIWTKAEFGSEPVEWSDEPLEKFGNIGLNIQGGVLYRPIDKLPLVLGVRPMWYMNLMKMDWQPIDDVSPNIAYGPDPEATMEVKGGSFGMSFTAAFWFKRRQSPAPKVMPDAPAIDNIADNSPYVNTGYDELNPIVTADGNTIYFSRNDHPKNTMGVGESQDIWMADISNGLDSAKAIHLDSPFNTQVFNYAAGITPDENTILVSGAYNNGVLEGKGYSLMNRTSTGWSKPQKMEIENYANMAKGSYAGAYISNDGQHLVMYFSPTEENVHDLYVSHRKQDGTWSKPEELGNLNTDKDEVSPFLASDGRTLYFSSNREGGLGSHDIWVAKRKGESWTDWTKPINLGDQVNTDGWDAYYSVDARGEYAYMVTYKNSKGLGDIARIKLKKEVQPDPVVLVKGKVLNQKTGEPLDARVAFSDLTDADKNGIASTNPATGEYKIVLTYGKAYSLLGQADNFVSVSKSLDLTEVGEYQEIEKDLMLVPIEVGQTVRLNNIFFQTGSATLDNKSQQELERLIQLLNDNPAMEIEISGHTDNVGAAQFNLDLSQKRANAVRDYLVDHGINTDRLQAVGYGMNKPEASNDTDEGRAINRRVEFTITKK